MRQGEDLRGRVVPQPGFGLPRSDAMPPSSENTRGSGTTLSECTRRLVAKPQARRHIGEMRPLLLSGLLCVPAVVMLYFSWPHDRGGRLEDATVAPVPMAAVSQSSTLTVSLPPRSQREPPQMDLDAWELVGAGSLTAELTPSEPALSRRKPIRTLHARASAARPASPVIVAQTTFRERPDTVWARVVQWLTQHEAGKMWSQAGAGGGAG